ncbi:MAG: hypothetical protein QM817_23895 [Archangium sp.]
MVFAIGARFVCMKCSLRGVTPKCSKCSGETIDLTTRDLDGAWALAKAHRDGRRLFSPAVMRQAKWLRRVALGLTVVNIIPAIIMTFVKDAGQAPISAVIAAAAVMLLVMAPLVFLFYWAFLFLAALTFHAMGVLFGWLSSWVPIGQLRLQIVTFISEIISRPLLGLIRIEPTELTSTAPLRGSLAAPLIIDLQFDRLAVMERADAVLTTPLRVKFDASGEEEPIELIGGTLVVAQPGNTLAPPELPKWLQPARSGTARRAEFATGTRVVVRRAAHGLVQLDVV